MARDEGGRRAAESTGGRRRDFETVLAGYIERLTDGELLDPDALREDHPDIAEELLQSLEAFVEAAPAQDPLPPLGTLGDYTLRRQIGRGGMGTVYDAWQNSMDRRVALKVLPRALAADTRAATRFIREAQIAGKLDHPNVVHVHATGVEEQVPYYSMEFVEGETLAQGLARIKDSEPETETPFGPKDSAAYFDGIGRAFAAVADGLQHAHSKGVVHRDIKPSNLIFDGEGQLRILDFGLARLEGQESLTLSGDFVGTPLYMSPEQARRKKISVDHRTDVYSLGATMYEAVCGRPPFRGKDRADTLSQIIERDPEDPRNVNARVPKHLETIVLKCLRKDAGDRYGTAEALGQDLRRFVRGDPVEARPQSRWQTLGSRVRRHRRALAWLSAVTGVLLVVAFWAYDRGESTGRWDTEAAFSYRPLVLEAALRIYGSEITVKAVEGVPGSLIDPALLCETPIRKEDFEVDSWLRRVSAATESLREMAKVRPDRPDAHYHLARAHLLLGDVATARDQLELLLEGFPDFVPASGLLSNLSRKRTHDGRDRGTGGEKELERLSASYRDDDWRAWWLRAFRHEKEKRWGEAAVAWKKLVDWKAQHGVPYVGASVEWHLRYGLALHRGKRYPAAIQQFAFVTNSWREFVEPALLLASAFYKYGDKQEAESILNDLYNREDSASSKKEVATWIAGVYCKLRDLEKGVRWAEEVGGPFRNRVKSFLEYFHWNYREAAATARRILVDDRNEHGLGYLGWPLVELTSGRAGPARDREVDELVQAAERNHDLQPDQGIAHALLIMARIREGKPADALAVASDSLARFPRDALVWRGRALALIELDRLPEAEDAARRAFELHRARYTAEALASVFRSQGRYAEAIEMFKKAVHRQPKRSTPYGELAGVLNRLERYKEAVEWCEKAADLLPENSSVHENLAFALWKLDRTEEALDVAERGIERVSDRPRLHLVRASILKDEGRIRDAAGSLVTVLDLDPGHDEARRALRHLLASANAELSASERKDLVARIGGLEEFEGSGEGTGKGTGEERDAAAPRRKGPRDPLN